MATAFGHSLRGWRTRRSLTQAELAFDAGVSTRHLSFVETGRTTPSRQLVLSLARRLALAPPERNILLLAAGFAPIFAPETIAPEPVKELLAAQEPAPALAFDRCWTLVAGNRLLGPLLEGVAPALLEPPVNLLRLALHPQGLAPRIGNLAPWRSRMLSRLRRRLENTGDPGLGALYRELAEDGAEEDAPARIAEPLLLHSDAGPLAFLCTTAAPLDTVAPALAVEVFLPADAGTAQYLHNLAARILPIR